jgi:HEAT repeat protein
MILFAALPVFGADDEKSTRETELGTINYGLDSDIVKLLGVLVSEKRYDYNAEIFELFENAKTTAVKEAAIKYFSAAEDNRLSEKALAVIADPYDENRTTVMLFLKYIGAIKLKAAAGSIRSLFEQETTEYFDGAAAALGMIGDEEDANFLAEYLNNDELSVPQRQTLMAALGKLKATSTLERLAEIAQDENENTMVRISAAGAIGEMKNAEYVPLLLSLYDKPNPNFRAAVVKALANFTTDDVKTLVVQAIRDEHVRVRMEAVNAAKVLEIQDAVPFLLFRAKSDPESTVKYAAYNALASIGAKDGIDFLVSVISDNKASDVSRVQAVRAFLAAGAVSGNSLKAITEITKDALADDKKKSFRYALGKEFAKSDESALADICKEFLSHKDLTTQGIGLDMFAKGRYSDVLSYVTAIAGNEKAGINKQKAQRILENVP